MWDMDYEKSKVKVTRSKLKHALRAILAGVRFAQDQTLTTSYYDNYMNDLLRPETYYADGQIKDEVYVFGSFIQSKMYHKGIKCSDCHDPHTTKLKHEGNAVCTSCHQHTAAKYDNSGHHRHQEGSAGAACVACHMPETPYMDVDLRADHSLRIPRPDLSVELNTPNACTACHLEKNNIDPSKRDALGVLRRLAIGSGCRSRN